MYKIDMSSSQLAVSQLCGVMKSILLKKFIQWLPTAVMKKFAHEFLGIYQIPYVVGDVDDSHIPIVAPRFHTSDYHNRKCFHSILLHDVVSSRCLFLNFDIGWAGSMHDANLWAMTDIGQFCEARRLSPFILVSDVVLPCRPWLLAPYKGHKDGLSQEEYHWNFIQSLTRMCIERAFGMLKSRWKILLKHVDVHLKNVPDLIFMCLVLHNICTKTKTIYGMVTIW